MPVLLIIVTGIYAFGIAINNDLTLTEATAVGGRQLALSRSATTDPCAQAVTYISNAGTLNASQISYSFIINGVTYPSNTTSCSGVPLIQSSPITVTTTYPCSISFYGINAVPGCTLKAQIQEVVQ